MADLSPPFSAEEIRAAFPVGMRIVFSIEDAERPPMRLAWDVVAADRKIMRMHITPQGLDGNPVSDPQDRTFTWDELVDHARFPPDLTTVSNGEVETPIGRHPAQVYTVTTIDALFTGTEQYHFVLSLPGPPVIRTSTRDGKEVYRMTMIERVLADDTPAP